MENSDKELINELIDDIEMNIRAARANAVFEIIAIRKGTDQLTMVMKASEAMYCQELEAGRFEMADRYLDVLEEILV